ncbi:MAG TPA: histidine kinase dimerization/phosphoacceptor domain -containing protein [Herpetosiphonaceae bacterium]|nr:histidine kinase dimerization/phosphoacceptor domain -containing protein [Herpetosiphonaceae bacterium]
MRVLIVDDNPDDRELVLHQLRADYPDVDAIGLFDEKRLSEVLSDQEPALVITDLHLGWLDGFAVFDQVKKHYPDCPVIMFTGTGDETAAVEAIKAGLDDYVVKSPRHLTRLRTSVRQVLQGAERKLALRQREDELRAALAHKDLVLRELHHRVKNNIQIMASLLWMRARRTKSDEVRAELQDLLARIEVLGRVQAKIYETEELDQVNVGAVLEEISRSLVEARGGGRVALDHRSRGTLTLPLQRASPLALLVYEVILNALKHAYPQDTSGKLTVEVNASDGDAEIIVSDAGIGFDRDTAEPGIGSRLVQALAREANVAVEKVSGPGAGTTVTIRLWGTVQS